MAAAPTPPRSSTAAAKRKVAIINLINDEDDETRLEAIRFASDINGIDDAKFENTKRMRIVGRVADWNLLTQEMSHNIGAEMRLVSTRDYTATACFSGCVIS